MFWQTPRDTSDIPLDLIYQENSMSKTKKPAMAFTKKPCVIATGIAISLMVAQSYAQTPAATPEKIEKLK